MLEQAGPMSAASAVLLAGRGKVGHGLFAALSARDAGGTARVRLVGSRTIDSGDLAWADVVVLAVADDAIAGVTESIADRLGATPVLHCAGARDATETGAAAEHGAMHPMVSFCRAETPPSLRGTALVIDARSTPAAIAAAKGIARRMGALAIVAEAQGASYHAAAAMVANGAAALAVGALPILESLGLQPAAAASALEGLLATVAHNIGETGGPEALTGPVARGDASTVQAHRAALRSLPDALRVYDAVAPAILTCARSAGLEPARAEAVREALDRDLG